ncbi:hypothetical protein OXX79_010564, partial [Metschnikowia pulcherrima]
MPNGTYQKLPLAASKEQDGNDTSISDTQPGFGSSQARNSEDSARSGLSQPPDAFEELEIGDTDPDSAPPGTSNMRMAFMNM